jgi:DNA-3-methyladenine glycosylase
MLGQILVHGERVGRIVETEAYVGPDDLASHARVGPKGRAQIMYGKPGVAYVYFVYGMHYCFNAVTDTDGHPGAVLVRAIESPLGGRGPALVCRALGIDRTCNGLDLTASELRLERGEPVADDDVRVGPRVGVAYAGEWATRPWRFWVAGAAISGRRVTGQPYERPVLG